MVFKGGLPFLPATKLAFPDTDFNQKARGQRQHPTRGRGDTRGVDQVYMKWPQRTGFLAVHLPHGKPDLALPIRCGPLSRVSHTLGSVGGGGAAAAEPGTHRLQWAKRARLAWVLDGRAQGLRLRQVLARDEETRQSRPDSSAPAVFPVTNSLNTLKLNQPAGDLGIQVWGRLKTLPVVKNH